MAEGKIYTAIPAIMKAVGIVGKNKKNETQKFMYRGVDDVMNALHPALVDNCVFIVPTIIEYRREERKTVKGGNLIYSICKISYRFCADDGSSIEVIAPGEGMDSGDKSINKAMAAAYKYACSQLLCIPTDEIKDSDSESHEVADRKINAQEKKLLAQAAERTGMALDKALAQHKCKTMDDVPLSIYTSWMLKLANTDSKVPVAPESSITDIPDGIEEEVPFK